MAGVATKHLKSCSRLILIDIHYSSPSLEREQQQQASQRIK